MSNPLRLFTMPAHERRLVLVALPIVLAARLGLWLLPLARLQRLLARIADTTATAQAHSDYADRAARAVQRASKLVPAATCLTQALATLTLLRRRGLVGRLRIGIQRGTDGAFHAHAWVEFGGRVIIGGTPESLASFTSMPAFRGETL